MRYLSEPGQREEFRDWLRGELVRLEFYQRRGNRYLVSEFVRYAAQRGAHVEEVSLGRYLRTRSPVLPTPETCRELARAFGLAPVVVLSAAGYVRPDDFTAAPLPREDDPVPAVEVPATSEQGVQSHGQD